MEKLRFSWTEVVKRFLPQPEVEEEKKEDEPRLVLLSPWGDLREEPRTKDRGKSKGSRPWSQITGITLHQTAVDFGTNAKRLLNVPVHGGTLNDGQIVLLHSPVHYLWHAHKLNKHDIGIEVSCRAAGIERIVKTFWRSKKEKAAGKTYVELVKEATDKQLEATRELCRYYIKLVAQNGGQILYIHAHRQGHSSRVGDPGSRIWEQVAIPIMQEFNLTPGPIGWKLGSGNPIPEAWDPEHGKDIRYSGSVRGL